MHNSDNETGNNLNTGYIHAKMLSEWANVATPHFIVTDDTHCTYHNSNSNVTSLVIKKVFHVQYFKWIMTNVSTTFDEAFASHDPRVAGNSTARKSYVMPFNEYLRVLSRHRSDRSGHINLFDKDLCPDN